MDKYWMHMADDAVMGEGTSSVCRKGTCVESGQPVAIKVYKRNVTSDDVQLKKFQRQISVLQELQKPLEPPEDSSLWCELLENTSPSEIFMQLIDYSKDANGKPGPDAQDGEMYVVTELASYSLKDYLKLRREQKKPLSIETTRTLSRAIMLVVAGLHAKGLVHLDLKPENLMIFSGVLKLIDVDGCVKVGSTIRLTDSSLSFSPCYCAPEWAHFLIEDAHEPTLKASPGLDVWSIGITLCELITLDPVLKPTYASFMRHGRSHREAAFLFMDWLSAIKKAPLPRDMQRSGNKELLDLLIGWLLVPNATKRKSLAQGLTHDFIMHADLSRATTGPLTPHANQQEEEALPAEAPRCRSRFPRPVDCSDKAVHKGILWKLCEGTDPKDPKHWLPRDMWISVNGSLCYFSLKEDKRLVLLDSHYLSTACVSRFEGGAREPAFIIRGQTDHEDQYDEHVFACESEEEFNEWVHAYEMIKADFVRPVRLGPELAQELHTFRLSVINRRQRVRRGSEDETAVFKAMLWKCKVNGDPKKESDWFEREMWLSMSGSLVYFSKREEKELVYYTQADLAHCSLAPIPDGEVSRPWAFQVLMPTVGGMEFTPGIFAAESEDMRTKWMEEFCKLRDSKKP